MPDRLIFHVDVNSAFLSWEAARRVKLGEADLRLIPSAVGGDPEKRTRRHPREVDSGEAAGRRHRRADFVRSAQMPRARIGAPRFQAV